MTSALRTLLLSLSIASGVACGNADSTQAQAAARPSQARSPLDAEALRGLAERSIWRGDRVPLAAGGGVAPAARIPGVDSRDTTIVQIDAQGVLYAREIGQTWLSWASGSGARDSVLVRVTSSFGANPPVMNWVMPKAPQAFVNTAYPVLTGITRRVGPNDNLQAVLIAAQPGDEVVLASGATFTGNFYLPKKTGNGWIVVRAEKVGALAGTRITPTTATGAAIVKSPNSEPAIRTAQGASKYRLVGFEVTQASGLEINYGLVVLGIGDKADNALSLLPSEIVLDRMYIHGTPTDQLKRCVAFNGIALAVIESWLSECHGQGFDSQGVAGWNGPGPFLIENNHIEGAGQAIIFGGADPLIAGLIPSDMVIRYNHLFKPMTWIRHKWEVKCTFELKHGQRILFEGNVMENHWADAQSGFAILFQAISQYNAAPWTVIQDVLIKDNVIKNSSSGVNLLSRSSDVGPTEGTRRIAVVNNLFEQVGRDPVVNSKGTILQLLSDLEDITFANNTITVNEPATHAIAMDYRKEQRLTIVNNVFPASDYGLFGSGQGTGAAALAHYAPGYVFKGNVIPEQMASQYPLDNWFPPRETAVPLSLTSMEACHTAEKSARRFSEERIGVNCKAIERTLAMQKTRSP